MTNYNTDFALWAKEQAVKLRTGALTELDRDNLAEELESLARALRRELTDRIARLLQNLFQWEYLDGVRLPAWYVAITEERAMIPRILEDAPSLRTTLADTFAEAWQSARERANGATGLSERLFSEQCPYSPSQVLDAAFWPGKWNDKQEGPISPSGDWLSLADELAQLDEAGSAFDVRRIPSTTNIVTLGIASERAVTASFAAAMKGEAQGNFITFASPELLFQTLTEPRWHIVKAMMGAGPLSISEVARHVRRDVQAVHDDVHALLNTGVLERTADDAIVFPYDAVHVDFMLSKAGEQLKADIGSLDSADGLKYQEQIRSEWEGREGQPLDALRGSVRRYDDSTDPVWPEAEKGHVNPVLHRLQQNMKAKTRRAPPPAHEADDWIETWDLGDEITQPSVKTWVPKADYFAFQALRFPHIGVGDQASRALNIQSLANEVFDDPAAAMHWMLSVTPLLGNVRPFDALATESGHDRVRALLLRLAHGDNE